jgi:hypothetical protein
MLSFLLPIEVIDILCELHMSCLVIPDFERDYCAQVYSSYIVDIKYMLLYFMWLHCLFMTAGKYYLFILH